MTPDATKITIGNNLDLIKRFIEGIVIEPRRSLLEWSKITRQTPAIKIGYVGQHLASLITGIRGTGTGGRGDDLADGTEVKSCNKVDQVDKCRECKNRVQRFERVCPICGSSNIERRNDSKWLFSVRDERELAQYLALDRILLILMDYPKFDDRIYSDIQIRAYEIYPNNPRMKVFGELLTNHYQNIFLPKLQNGQHTNPMNLHPMGIQFYKCNPILIFSCVIENVDSCDAEIKIDVGGYVAPKECRDSIPSVMMPSALLSDSKSEWRALIDNADFESEIRPLLREDGISKEYFDRLSVKDKQKVLPLIDERLRNYIPLRSIVSVTQRAVYHRQ